MNAVSSKEAGSVLTRAGARTGMVDLLGVRIIWEKKKKKGKRLGYLPKKELIAEVRKIFPNAAVLPNRK
jgi:hypothetical protein